MDRSSTKLKLSGAASVSNGGSATPFAGSNFPSGFTNVYFDSSSTVEFNGAAQTIPLPTAATTYGNLTLSGSGIKTVGGNISISSALDIGTGVTMALGNNTTTLKSDQGNTAFVRPLNGTITYGTGSFIIERYLFAAASWRLMATPITSGSSPTISASWREGEAIGTYSKVGFGTRITGPTGMDEYTQRASMKYYNMANNTYVDVKAVDLALPIQKDQGYFVFVRGDRTVGVGGTGVTTLRIAGQLRTGDQTFSVLPKIAPSSGFQSVGNPFASRIDLTNVILSTSGLNESFYIWNPRGGLYGLGQFELYVRSGANFVQSPGGTILNTIESGQAFFLQNSSTTTPGSITIKESDKIIGSRLGGRAGVTSPTLEINLFSNDAVNQALLDGVLLNFDAAYSNSLDNNDVRKISNTYDNISLKLGTDNLAVERRAVLTATDTIRLNIAGMRVAAYKLQIDPSVLGNLALNAFLVDKFLASETALSLIAVTNMPFSITNDAGSRRADRFMIVFKQVKPMRFVKINAVRNTNNTATVNWYTENENNINTYSIERSKDGINFSELGKQMPTANNNGNPYYSFIDAAPDDGINWYRIKTNTINGTTQLSEFAKIGATEILLPSAITIYPNPVQEGKVHIRFVNEKVGKYQIMVLNMTGQTVYSEVLRLETNNFKKIISVGNAAAGNYRVTIINEEGAIKKLSFLVK